VTETQLTRSGARIFVLRGNRELCGATGARWQRGWISERSEPF
jgi:hypothetical protein